MCTHCKALTNGVGKEFHRTTVIRHMKKEQEEQDLENAYQNLHSEENYSEENEETSYEERSSPIKISDNKEIPIEEIFYILYYFYYYMHTFFCILMIPIILQLHFSNSIIFLKLYL
jgi:hypothetical protein